MRDPEHRHGRARRLRLSVCMTAAALGLAACGSAAGSAGGGGSGSKAHSLAAESGKEIFETAGCAGCHTLAAAGSDGTVGPDLDNLKPSMATVIHQVTNGGGGMPSFKSQLSRTEIVKVATFVSESAH